MKLIDFITKNTSKRRIFHSYYQRSSSSEFFTGKSHPKLHSRFNFCYSGSGLRPKPPHSIYSSFFRNSYYCSVPSSLKNQKMSLLSWYLSVLNSRPILTKSISAAVIYTAADLTSQTITMPPSGTLDLLRTLRMAGYGLFILGLSQHIWFNFIGRMLPKRDVLTTLKKIVAGQLVFGPYITSFFYTYNAALKGENSTEIAGRLKRDLLPTLLNGLLFWPLCDFFTYKVLPVHLQPLMNSTFAYIWTIYLTYMASLQKTATD